MGVPSLFRWMHRKYTNAIYAVNGSKVDNLYLDLNGIIHPCCHPSNRPAPETEEQMFREIYRTIDHLVNIVCPQELLYVAVDGVAPRAKMNQQRERRFKSGEVLAAFDPNTITPGTPFMVRLQSSLIRYIEQRISSGEGQWGKILVIYSGCDVPGEGEHKIYDFVRSIKGNNVRHAICGLDADLIFLSLVTHEKSFKVVREDVFWIEREERSMCELCKVSGHSTKNCGQQSMFPPYIYLDIGIVREYLRKEFEHVLQIGADMNRMVNDWVFVCFFVGNDFLPCIPSMDIRVSAIETLTKSYIQGLLERKRYLTDGSKICIPELTMMMETLAKEETVLLKAKLDSYVKISKRRNEEPREEDINNKLYEKRGRSAYYSKRLHAHTQKEIEKVCIEYVKGLAWVLQYYQKGVPSWEWYYPLHFAPLAEDIGKALSKYPADKEFVFEMGFSKRPLEQVMAVLPPASSDSVPSALHRIFTESPENYPENVEIDMFGKSQAWQGVALLPFLDYKKLVSFVRACMQDATLEEVSRNVEGRELLIVPLGHKEYSAAESVYINFMRCIGVKVESKYYRGSMSMCMQSILPGVKGVLKEEGTEYVVRSVAVYFKAAPGKE